MKKISIIVLIMCCWTIVSAQRKGDSLLIKKEMAIKGTINPPITSGSRTLQTDAKVIAIQPVKLNIASKVVNRVLSKDLAIDQFNIVYEPMLKRYTLKCRVFNAGTTDVDLKLLSYNARGSQNTLATAVSTSDPAFVETTYPINIPFDLQTELPADWVKDGNKLKLLNGYYSGKISALFVTGRDPNSGWVFTIDNNTILKPGESVYAMAFDNVVWERNIIGLGPHRIYTIKIDPLNKIGDQNLNNNTIYVTVDNYY